MVEREEGMPARAANTLPTELSCLDLFCRSPFLNPASKYFVGGMGKEKQFSDFLSQSKKTKEGKGFIPLFIKHMRMINLKASS